LASESLILVQKRRQYFIRTHNETLSVAMRVNNPDCRPSRINSRHPSQTPPGFLEIVGDDSSLLLSWIDP